MELQRDSLIAHALIHRPRWLMISGSFVLSFLALPSTPSMAPMVALLAALLSAAHDSRAHRPNRARAAELWLSVAMGGTLARMGASLSALSTPWGSVALSLAFMALTSAVTFAAVMLSVNVAFRTYTLYGWSRLCIFPVVWTALGWLESLTPLGRLFAWTPLQGNDVYDWMLPYMGLPAIDWITAAWAVVLAEAFMYAGPAEEQKDLDRFTDDPNADALPVEEYDRPRRHMPKLATLLIALALPRFVHNPFPTAELQQPEHSTAVTVACVLPPHSDDSALKRYVQESKRLISGSRLLLWPEGAVSVQTVKEKDDMFTAVQEILKNQPYTWVAVSYTEPAETRGKRRNAVTVVNHERKLFTYYKRNLVPLVESYGQVTEDEPPQVYDIPIFVSKHIQDVPVSAGICLDFASSLPKLARKPALVLAPAHTWHADIGETMAAHAKLRARELGTRILWCDGGAGGQSALFGPEGDEVHKVGEGSWVKTFQVPFPFEEPRTLYAVLGSLVPGLLLCLVLPLLPVTATGFAALPSLAPTRDWLTARWVSARDTIALRFSGRREAGRQDERTPLIRDLLDLDP